MLLPAPPPLSRRTALRLGAAAALARGLPAWAQAAAGPRVALVIGNAAYASAPLANAGNDARAMGALLAGMGFRVVEARDASRARMEQALAQTRELLAGQGGTALLYYAGHGLQLDWRNYLLPVDAAPASAAEVPRLALDTQTVLDAFRDAGTRMNIVVLDACRDNPFGRSASAKGLAPLDAPPGSFLAYATAPGNVAEDGSAADGNGLYTRFLLQELQRPEARIEDVFKRVRLQVRRASQGRQVPWESTSLEDDFVFASASRAPEPTAAEREASFKVEAADWAAVRATRNPDELYAYLQKYPSGWFAEPAQFRLDRLQAPLALPQLDSSAAEHKPRGADRWAVGDTQTWQRTDLASGRVDAPFEQRVTALQGDRVIFNHGALERDQMGALHKSARTRFDPPLLRVPAELAVGKRWRSVYRARDDSGAEHIGVQDSRVAALEDVEVPAGRFRAYRVDHHGALGGSVSFSQSAWIDPATMWSVRFDSEWHENRRRTEHYSERLVAMARGRPAPPPRPAPPNPDGY